MTVSTATSKRHYWLTAFIIIILLLSAFYIHTHYEFKKVETTSGLQGEARHNPLYALRLFLKQMGIPTIQQKIPHNISHFPSTDTTIILHHQRNNISSHRIDLLLQWVAKGGKLITRANIDNHYKHQGEETFQKDENEKKETDSATSSMAETIDDYTDDWLQQQLNIYTSGFIELSTIINNNHSINYGRNKKKTNCDHTTCEQDQLILDLRESKKQQHFESTFQLKTFPKPYLIDIGIGFYPIENMKKDDASFSINNHVFLIQRPWGEGLITIASDLDFIGNILLREADNAEIIWSLTQQNHTVDTAIPVWLIDNDSTPSLFNILWQHSWALLITFILLFCLWFLHS